MATVHIIGEEFHIFQNHFDERSIFRRSKFTIFNGKQKVEFVVS